MKKITFLIGLFSSHNLFAAGTVNFIEVKEELVTFSITESKTTPSPRCVAEDTKNLWTIKTNTPTGKATYTLIMMAMSTGAKVQVQTANDCAFASGLERARRVWVTKNENNL